MAKGYAAERPSGELKEIEYDLGPLAADQVEIAVEHCGICRSDLSMMDNECGVTEYPFVPGHEIVGVVGAVPGRLSVEIFPMLIGQKSISASPLGSPATTAQMLDFAARHDIRPVVETFPFPRVNEAMERLREGKPRYRIVLTR